MEKIEKVKEIAKKSISFLLSLKQMDPNDQLN
jgi:hypothetical protein